MTVIDLAPLSVLDEQSGYVHHFMDAALWSPYVQVVCERHNLSPAGFIHTGIPGTCPVFTVGERWVVKFFGRLFAGGESFLVERAAGRLVERDPELSAVRVRAEGSLGSSGGREPWHWPYLVFDYIAGISVGQVFESLSFVERRRIAAEMGAFTRRLHALRLGDPTSAAVFPPSWEDFRRFLEVQRAACVERRDQEGRLPPHLVAQIDAYLCPLDDLIEWERPPHLIHADLTGDHLLGQVGEEGNTWRSAAVIDFGDARVGSLFYELAALHLDLFRGDPRLLNAFFSNYGPPPPDFTRRAMSTALLHEFDVLGMLGDLSEVVTLEDLAERIWVF